MMMVGIISATQAATDDSTATGDFLARIHMPIIDISGQTNRHVFVARGTEKDWQGHPGTVLLPDGKTIFCVWQGRRDGSGQHGAPVGYLKRSDDGGLTWSDYISVPANWLEIGRGSPTIHRLVDASGTARLFVFCRDEERTTFLVAISVDAGTTWSPMHPLPLAKPEDDPITGWTAPMSILESKAPDGRRRHLMWYEHNRDGKPEPGVIWQSASYDGGLTWGESKPVVDKAGSAEPACVRSPDGKQLLLLIRENSREMNSIFAVSRDDGESWTEPRLLPLALTGDRHLPRYAPDGRLVVVFRSLKPGRPGNLVPKLREALDSHFMAWVGKYEDIVEGREGEFLIKLLHSHEGGNHTYPGFEILPDGTFVATTYIKYRPGPDLHSVVSVRFRLEELDAIRTEAQNKAQPAGEVLYNGIVLPGTWPPRYAEHEFSAEAVAERTTAAVPYLLDPPAIIPIDVGRQLFVDDFLIERTSLQRVYGRPQWHHGNPVLRPDRPWEKAGGSPTAMPFSDGVWYDPGENIFKMWYMAGFVKATAYATSRDGISWEKPDLDVALWEGRPSNIVQPHGRDSCTVWMDLEEPDSSQRYKMVYRGKGEGTAVLRTYVSGDGIHWNAFREGCDVADRSTVFFNPFRRVWVFSIKDTGAPVGDPGRFRRYREHAEFSSAVEGSRASRAWVKDLPLWSRADTLDPRRPELNVQPELYNLDAVAYESLMLGLFTIWSGQPDDRPKPNHVAVGFSRDGFHWHRPDRRPFLDVSETVGEWNWGNVQSAGGGCMVVGDLLYFYASGRAGERGGNNSGVCATGLATLRRDGFASMEAEDREGTLTTRLLTFKGNRLFVNAAVREGGALRAEILDADGKPVAPFTMDRCSPVVIDSTHAPIVWKNGSNLSSLAGKPVRIRFSLARGSLYAFWVSPDVSGASYGYVAAGGPGFSSSIDTVGNEKRQYDQVHCK